MWNALAFGDAQPYELICWNMAERFGWTLEYIDNLPMAKLVEFLQIEDGKIHASESIRKRTNK